MLDRQSDTTWQDISKLLASANANASFNRPSSYSVNGYEGLLVCSSAGIRLTYLRLLFMYGKGGSEEVPLKTEWRRTIDLEMATLRGPWWYKKRPER